jgi:hypothetical protein
MSKELEKIELYAVRNSQGQWFRAKGYGGYGESWTDTFARARVYSKIGPARATISFFANSNKYPSPDLVRLCVTKVEVIDESERVEKVKLAKRKREALQKKWDSEQQLKRAQQALDKAKADIESLTRKRP